MRPIGKWPTASGLSGMPAFDKILNQTHIWQVTLLLANADKPLPPGTLELLKQPLDLDPAALAAPQPSTAPAQKITDQEMKCDAVGHSARLEMTVWRRASS